MSLDNLLAHAQANKGQAKIVQTLTKYFRDNGVPLQIGMDSVKKEVAEGLKLIPFESSVLGIKPIGNGTAQIHFFTTGTPKDLIDDMEYFYKYMKDNGISVVYDTAPNDVTTTGLQRLGAQVMQSDNPKYKFKAQI